MILPIHGEVAARSADGGGSPFTLRLRLTPSTTPLRVVVPLPVNGEDL